MRVAAFTQLCKQADAFAPGVHSSNRHKEQATEKDTRVQQTGNSTLHALDILQMTARTLPMNATTNMRQLTNPGCRSGWLG